MNNCAVHPGAVAVFTCSRCGSFACSACASQQADLCAACDRLRGLVLGSDVSAGGLIGDSFRLVLRFGSIIAALAIAETAVSTVLDLARSETAGNLFAVVVLWLASAAVTTIVQASWISLLSSAAKGTPIGLQEAVTRGAQVALPLFGCNLVLGLGVGLGFLFLVVPGIILALGWCLAPTAVVDGQRSPIDALGDSWRLTDGHRGTLFLSFLATGIVVIAIAAVTGAVLGVLRAQLPAASLFLNAGQSAIVTIAAAPVITVPVLTYLRLNRRSGG